MLKRNQLNLEELVNLNRSDRASYMERFCQLYNVNYEINFRMDYDHVVCDPDGDFDELCDDSIITYEEAFYINKVVREEDDNILNFKEHDYMGTVILVQEGKKYKANIIAYDNGCVLTDGFDLTSVREAEEEK